MLLPEPVILVSGCLALAQAFVAACGCLRQHPQNLGQGAIQKTWADLEAHLSTLGRLCIIRILKAATAEIGLHNVGNMPNASSCTMITIKLTCLQRRCYCKSLGLPFTLIDKFPLLVTAVRKKDGLSYYTAFVPPIWTVRFSPIIPPVCRTHRFTGHSEAIVTLSARLSNSIKGRA